MDEQVKPPITILIADDHPLIRQGIQMALSTESDLRVVGEAADGVEALLSIDLFKPDVVILDLDMPKKDGLAVVQELKRLNSPVGVIILTLHTGADLLYKAVDLGIRGYIIKSSAVTEIAEGVRRVAGGGSYVSETVRQALQKGRPVKTLPAELQALTPVELRVVCKIAEGFTSREIAATLDLSDRTVENYRTVICNKLALTGPNALLRYALSHRDLLIR